VPFHGQVDYMYTTCHKAGGAAVESGSCSFGTRPIGHYQIFLVHGVANPASVIARTEVFSVEVVAASSSPPTISPSEAPTHKPTDEPTSGPTGQPTHDPSWSPTVTPAVISPDQPDFLTTEIVKVSFSYSISEALPDDWIAIYPPGKERENGTVPQGVTAWTYVCGTQGLCESAVALGTVSFSGLQEGEYEVFLLRNPNEPPPYHGGYEVIASSNIFRVDLVTYAPTTLAPTAVPSNIPTVKPTVAPTASPSKEPTAGPTVSPTMIPTRSPSAEPTEDPTRGPTVHPSSTPTATPTEAPMSEPSIGPSNKPTDGPTHAPTESITISPTLAPMSVPSKEPTATPTQGPSMGPTSHPTILPTTYPTTTLPTKIPTEAPTSIPTFGPTEHPISAPTNYPTFSPTFQPTASPSYSPTDLPTSTQVAGPGTNSRTLETIHDGGARNYGAMFEVEAHTSVEITSYSAHCQTTNPIGVEVWTKEGELKKKEKEENGWGKICTSTVIGEGENKFTGIPENDCTAVPMSSGQVRSFYVTFTASVMLYTSTGWDEGSVFTTDGDISIMVGRGVKQNFGKSSKKRLFNGGITYKSPARAAPGAEKVARYPLGNNPLSMAPPNIILDGNLGSACEDDDDCDLGKCSALHVCSIEES